MADTGADAMFAAEDEHFDLPSLMRAGSWGIGAAVAVAVAVMASRSETGGQRIGIALSSIKAPASRATAAQLLASANGAEGEARQLAEAVRMLTNDRERLSTRIAAIERNLDDLTGSIPRTPPPAPRQDGAIAIPPAPPAPAVAAPSLPAIPSSVPAMPPAAKPSDDVPLAPPGASNPASPPAAMPAPLPPPATRSSPLPVIQVPVVQVSPPPPPAAGRVATAHAAAASTADGSASTSAAPEAVATRTDFGVDLGGATSIEGLRQLWASLKANQSSLLEGLRPIMTVRENARPGALELRLVAGPLANAGLAARLCAALSTAGRSCEPAVFDGQRLALR
jgi:hypothetical protein